MKIFQNSMSDFSTRHNYVNFFCILTEISQSWCLNIYVLILRLACYCYRENNKISDLIKFHTLTLMDFNIYLEQKLSLVHFVNLVSLLVEKSQTSMLSLLSFVLPLKISTVISQFFIYLTYHVTHGILLLLEVILAITSTT